MYVRAHVCACRCVCEFVYVCVCARAGGGHAHGCVRGNMWLEPLELTRQCNGRVNVHGVKPEENDDALRDGFCDVRFDCGDKGGDYAVPTHWCVFKNEHVPWDGSCVRVCLLAECLRTCTASQSPTALHACGQASVCI